MYFLFFCSHLLYTEELLSNIVRSSEDKLNDVGHVLADTPVLFNFKRYSGKFKDWDACKLIGRPYLWAQQLVGLDCYPTNLTSDFNKSGPCLDQIDQPNSTCSNQSGPTKLDDLYQMNFGRVQWFLDALYCRLMDRLYLIDEVFLMVSLF